MFLCSLFWRKKERIKTENRNTPSEDENEMKNVKKEFEENSRPVNEQLSRAHETTENQVPEITNYVSQVEELDRKNLDLHNTVVNLKLIPNSKSS